MLVLSRLAGQSIMIGDGIEIRVLSIKEDKVRLGISAPKGIAVHRKEIFEEIQAANRDAAQAAPPDVGRLGEALRHPPAPGEGQGGAGTPPPAGPEKGETPPKV